MTASLMAEEGLVAPGATAQKLASSFRFTEGPAVAPNGDVYFSDIPNNRIHIWSTDGKLSTYRSESGGANGLYFDRKGNLYACEGGNRRVTVTDPHGKLAVLSERYQEKKLNSPNDLWIDPQGGVYFSDPRYGKMEDMEQDGFHVYYVSPDRRKLMRVTTDLVKPNGVLGSADGKQLFVADPGASKTYVYRIQADATLADKREFAPQGSDGMTRDERGNVYLTAKEGLVVYDPEGKKIATIAVPESPANCCFGGADRKTLFITARTSLYSIPMTVRGQDR
jgi:gluconolactonase